MATDPVHVPMAKQFRDESENRLLRHDFSLMEKERDDAHDDNSLAMQKIADLTRENERLEARIVELELTAEVAKDRL